MIAENGLVENNIEKCNLSIINDSTTNKGRNEANMEIKCIRIFDKSSMAYRKKSLCI